jgi:capsular exopolysaccharide synthesis family protein
VQAADAAQAARLANTIAQIHIDDQVTAKVASMLSSRDVLQARLAQARDEIVLSEASFNEFLNQSTVQLATLPQGSSLQDLTGQIDALFVERERANDEAQRLVADLANENWDVLATALASNETALLQEQRNKLAAQLSAVDVSSPAARELQVQLASAEAELTTLVNVELATLREHLTNLDAQQVSLRDALRTEVMQSDLPADILTGLYDLQSKAVFAREQYQALLNRSLQLENQSGLQMADSRIASPAVAPSTHAFPNTGLFLIVGAVLGLVLGIAVSITYESLVGGFMTQEQIEAILRTRVAATVPRLKLEPGNDTLADLVITAPLSRFAEAMRRTRMAIDQTLSGTAAKRSNTGQVVMVTSTAPQEGKSTTATALARSYALAGRRALLIDCDLRHPALARQLDLVPELGLLEMLEGRNGPADLSRMLRRENDTDLSLLLGARGTDGLTETLLAGARFERLISAAAEIFDVIVLDTPPIEPVVDGLYIAPHADLILLVTRWASTSQRETKQALAHLTQAKRPSAQIISLLNATAEPRAGRKQHNRRFYNPDYA